jgi:type VI secretion system secreted protein VgrG
MAISDILHSLSALMPGKPVFAIDLDGLPLSVVGFTGHEAISELYEFTIEIAGPELDPDTLVGKPALLTIKGLDEPRYVHGIVAHAEYVGHSRSQDLYTLTLTPWAHRLLHRAGSRIFQDQTTEQIVQAVLAKAGVPSDKFRFDLSGEYAARNYCVQYRESDLDFVSRLLEEDGIFYFFEHHADKHVLVMADKAGAHPPIPGDPALWFNPPGGFVNDREHVDSVSLRQSVRPGRVSLRDFYFPTPDAAMEVGEAADRDPELEVYDYPGEYQDRGPRRAGPRPDDRQARGSRRCRRTGGIGNGSSDCMRLTAGTRSRCRRTRATSSTRATSWCGWSSTRAQPQVLDEDESGEFSYHNEFTCHGEHGAVSAERA